MIDWQDNDASPGLLAYSADDMSIYTIYHASYEYQLMHNNHIVKTGTLDDCKEFAEKIESALPAAKCTTKKTPKVIVEDDMSLTPEERRNKLR